MAKYTRKEWKKQNHIEVNIVNKKFNLRKPVNNKRYRRICDKLRKSYNLTK